MNEQTLVVAEWKLLRKNDEGTQDVVGTKYSIHLSEEDANAFYDEYVKKLPCALDCSALHEEYLRKEGRFERVRSPSGCYELLVIQIGDANGIWKEKKPCSINSEGIRENHCV